MISVVVPIFNEQENLTQLHRRLVHSLEKTQLAFEIVLVDDGSSDESPALLAQLASAHDHVKVVTLSRNFGHQPAVTAGIRHATGDAVVLIDGDLQDPPELVVDLVREWQRGYQVVVAQRRSRPERGLRGLGFRLFYPLLRKFTELPHIPSAGIFGLMDRAVVDEFNQLPERSRFIPGLRLWLGFSQTTVSYDRHLRAAGEPKQTLSRLVKYAANAIFSFSYKPLRAATYGGLLAAAFGFATAVYFVGKRMMGLEQAETGFTTLLSMVIFLGGIQLLGIGLLGEYVGRVYEEVKQRPLYVVKSTKNITRSNSDQSTASASTLRKVA
jgi:polyisoprenyl-phosphate glycosyltransferase